MMSAQPTASVVPLWWPGVFAAFQVPAKWKSSPNTSQRSPRAHGHSELLMSRAGHRSTACKATSGNFWNPRASCPTVSKSRGTTSKGKGSKSKVTGKPGKSHPCVQKHARNRDKQTGKCVRAKKGRLQRSKNVRGCSPSSRSNHSGVGLREGPRTSPHHCLKCVYRTNHGSQ